MEPPQRILLTGAAGFIGSHLARRLVEEGYTTGILVRPSSDLRRLADILGRLHLVPADLRDGDTVLAAVSSFRPDALLHLATHYAAEHRPEETGVLVDTNVKGTVNLLEACRQAGVAFVVNTSSCSLYRDTGRPMVETDPVHPQNLYALTKFAAEEACRFYSARYGVESASLRIFPPYGPADNARRMVPYVIGSLLRGERVQLTTGKQQWDFVYVGDIADAYLAVLRRPGAAAAAGVLNVGTSEPHSVREVVEALKEITGSVSELAWGAVPHRATEVWFNSADIRRIGHVLGWQPKVPLRDGLRRTIDWYRAQEGDHAGE